MTAITATPIAQREIVVVMRSQTLKVVSRDSGGRTLATASLIFGMSTSRKIATKTTVKMPRAKEKTFPATPTSAESAVGMVFASCWEPSCAFSAPPVFPSQSSSPESRRFWTSCGRSLRKSLMLESSGTASRSASSVTRMTEPRTRIVEASPRPSGVFAISRRTGYSNTKARNAPTKTSRSASESDRSSQTPSTTAVPTKSARIGTITWTVGNRIPDPRTLAGSLTPSSYDAGRWRPPSAGYVGAGTGVSVSLSLGQNR